MMRSMWSNEWPWPICGDAYTVSGNCLASPQAKTQSVYNFVNRVGPVKAIPEVARDNRMVFYGLSDFISYLLEPITENEIDSASLFMSDAQSNGCSLPFDRDLWMRVLDEYEGRLPIKIEAIEEGSVFWPNEPVIQVTSLGKGFGEMAAMIEAVMVGMVSCATARATITRHWLERIRERVKKYHPLWTPEQIDRLSQWMIHDFGMRASSTPQEADLYGRAHLLSFHGTDTFNAAYSAWIRGLRRPTGTSVLALAHRIVQGYADEYDAYKQIYFISKDAACRGQMAIGSYVADCYNFRNAVTQHLLPLAKNGDAIVVARPDSGDFLEDIRFVVQTALANDLYSLDENGLAVATTLRFIQGDSMNPSKVDQVFDMLEGMHVNPVEWGIFGVGGYLRNTANRDLFSSAYKLSAKYNDFFETLEPVVKLSHTPAKMSVPGPNCLLRNTTEYGRPDQLNTTPTVCFDGEDHDILCMYYHMVNMYEVYYDGGRAEVCECSPIYESFRMNQMRAIETFDEYSCVHPDRGSVEYSPLSQAVQDVQRRVIERYRGV